MKTIRTITLSMMLMVPAAMMWADNINEDKAKSMAQGFLQTNTRVRTAAANKPLKLAAQSTGYYAYNIGQGCGYVIVATDDNVENTILGYSDKGTFDTTRMPDNMRWWLTEYDRQVEEASKLSKEQLRSIRTRHVAPATEYTEISPLLTTRWNQDAPYNDLCPVDDSGKRSMTGCVATAMAQVMNYHKWPKTGTGSNSYDWYDGNVLSCDFSQSTYDWDNMLDTYNESSPAEAKTAVAKLMYDVGIAVNMNYSSSASGAFSTSVATAARDFFRYPKGTTFKIRTYYYKQEWEDMIYQELANNRPVYYSGSGTGGHAFVCDGYSADGFFHFNWGWGGNADGYFRLTLLDPDFNGIGSSSGGYSSGQTVVAGMDKKATEEVPEVYMSKPFSLSPTGEEMDKGASFTVTGTYDIYFIGTETESLTLGVKAEPTDNGKVEHIKGFLSFKPDFGIQIPNVNYSINVADMEGLAPGTYRITPAVYSEQSGKWYDMKGRTRDEGYEWYATVGTDKKVKIIKGTSTIASLALEAFEITDERIIAGNNFTCKARVKSTGGEYAGSLTVGIFKDTEQTSFWEAYASAFCDISDEESINAALTVTAPDKAGTYYLYLLEEYGNYYGVLDMKTITVEEGCTTGKLTLDENYPIISDGERIIAGQKFKAHLKFTCTGGDYKSNISLRIYMPNNTSDGLYYDRGEVGSTIADIKAGETREVIIPCIAPAEAAPDVLLVAIDALRNRHYTKNTFASIDVLDVHNIQARISDAGYATMVAGYNIVVPEKDVEIYGVNIKEGKAKLFRIEPGTTVPQETGLLLKGNEGTYDIATTESRGEELFANQLKAALTEVTADGRQYALRKKDGSVGFAKIQSGVKIPAGKAYLEVNDDDALTAFYDINGGASAINSTTQADTSSPVFYTIEGTRTLKPTKGLYIRKDGKKIMITSKQVNE